MVISIGKGNSYGYSTQEVMNRLKAKGIPVYRTNESGNVVATSNWTNISFNMKPESYHGVMSSSTSSISSSSNTSTYQL